ncbi:hypothetical protein Tco_0884792 [Tanacetum coccineum]
MCRYPNTRPPMLDRTDFASWQQRIRLYCRGKENGVNILKSIDEGPFQMETFRKHLAEDKERYNADIWATNILLQGLPKDIYSLINHYTDAKNIWDNVKMLPKNALNSKFVNNMLPEWGRFVTTMKLNRGLRDSNYDQLYAYLKQHEAHANENKMMLERFTQPNVDPLALISMALVMRELKTRVGNDNPCQARQIECPNHKGVLNKPRNVTSLRTLDFQITQLTEKVSVLQEQNELFRAENEKVKQHYKELYDSIKITRAKHIEQTTALLTENENLKAQIHENLKCNTIESVKPKDFIATPESVETLREIVEEAKVERPLDRSIVSACCYTKHSQELLEYAIGTCPKTFNQRDKNHPPTPVIRKKQVTFEEQYDTSNRVNSCIDASGSQPRSNTKKNRILPAKSVNMQKVEDHPRTIKSRLKTTNRVDSSISSKRTVINLNSHFVCKTCNKCLISANHDLCVVTYLHSVNASASVKTVVRNVTQVWTPKQVKQVWKPKKVKQVWKPTGKTLNTIGYQWMPTGRTFTLGEQCPLTRLTKPNKVSAIAYANPREPKQNWGSNFPNSPSSSVFKCRFIGTVTFGNDHFGAIMGYGDYVIGDSVISRVYYVEGLGHNLFSVG